MLIKCKECGHDVSDKAVSCPNCGYPINLPSAPVKSPQKANRTRKYRRLPNGYGQIRKLSGKRRNPYAVYPPVTEYKDNGVSVQPKALGYFETYQDAMECLIAYNKAPYDVKQRDLTFKQVYEMFFADKYNPNSKKQYSKASQVSTTSAYKNLSALHDLKFSEIRTETMQNAIDSCTLKYASLELMVSLLKNMSKFALKKDIIAKDYSAFVKINIPDDDEKGVPFTEEEIKLLWKHKDDKIVQTILIMIYSGMRISELKTITPNYEEQILIGGVKTKAGINRVIPIHNSVLQFVKDFDKKNYVAKTFRDTKFYPMLQKLGISETVDGTKRTPHDCRHTFSWLADKYGMDDLAKHLIMGHSLGSDVEKSVYGHRTNKELLNEVNKIKIPSKT